MAGDEEVEPAVAVEVVHDRPAGLIDPVAQPRGLADVGEPADVELGVEEPLQVQPEPGIDPVGVFRQGHVGQIQQPADLQVVGELLEILGEMADGQAGARRLRVHGRTGDGKDAGAIAQAHEAILVLAAPQGHDPLEVDHGAEGRLGQQPVPFDERPEFLQHLVRPLGLALVAQQGRLEIERREAAVAVDLRIGQLPVDDLDPPMTRPPPMLGDLPE